MGQQVRLVTRLPVAADPASALLFCPFLDGLDPACLWLGPLAWHDCNATLLAALRPIPAGAVVFAGVFCADPFRATADVLAALRAAGVVGVANLPSTRFIDGAFARTLDGLNLGHQRELAFLRDAAAAGFRIAACVADPAEADALAPELLILCRDGPLPPGRRSVRLRDLLGGDGGGEQ